MAKWNNRELGFDLKKYSTKCSGQKTIILLIGVCSLAWPLRTRVISNSISFSSTCFRGSCHIHAWDGCGGLSAFPDLKKWVCSDIIRHWHTGALRWPIGIAMIIGLSAGGAIVLATMAASASLQSPRRPPWKLPCRKQTPRYLTASLGITFHLTSLPVYRSITTSPTVVVRLFSSDLIK